MQPGNGQFSELFPLGLYQNRDFSNLQNIQLEYDVASEPYIGKDAHIEAYDRMPIEAFGKSVLAKLGWQEGKLLGRTNNNTD